LDVCRALAVLGMLIVNFNWIMQTWHWESGPVWASIIDEQLMGRASGTFVVLAGVGLSLMMRATPDEDRSLYYGCVARRAIFLFVVGMVLFTYWRGDILHFYGIYFALALTFLAAPTSLLAAGAVSVIVAAAILRFYIDYNWGWDWSIDRYVDLWTWHGFLRNLMVNGLHPILPWFAFVLVGLWLGRQDFGDGRTRLRLFLGGAAVAIVCNALGNIYPEGDVFRDRDQIFIAIDGWPPGPLYVIAASGTAVAVIMTCLELGRRFGASLPMQGLARTGRMALTVYVIHGIVLTTWFDAVCQRGRECNALDALVAALVLYGICVVAAYLWLGIFANGPLEAVMRFVAPTPSAIRRRRPRVARTA
jgi:uncharacterized protein